MRSAPQLLDSVTWPLSIAAAKKHGDLPSRSRFYPQMKRAWFCIRPPRPETTPGTGSGLLPLADFS